MLKEKLSVVRHKMAASFREHVRFATLDMIFILVFINVFQWVFGAENSITGVIFAILMSASMVRDLTAAPLKNLVRQALILALIATAACLVAALPPLAALPLNFAAVCFILYAYTFEYASHIYFPYILSYLFLVFIAPIPVAHLPKRLLAMAAGAVCVILYQWFMGRSRVVDTAQDVLTFITDEALMCIGCLLSGKGIPDDPEKVRHNLCKLSRIIDQRRKRALCCSQASFAMLDAGRGLEHLILLLYDMEGVPTPQRAALLENIADTLKGFRRFIGRQADAIAPLCPAAFIAQESDACARELYNALDYIRAHLLAMTQPEQRAQYPRTLLSFTVRLKAALNVSPVRVAYALRTAAVLSACTMAVQLLGLPHGKWLLFTVASVSLPYADDVGTKAKKRFLATIIGGLASVALYSLFPSLPVRTGIMMLSGYLSFFFTDYTGTYACSTIGALGGAVATSCFGIHEVGRMFAVRVGYIVLGIVIAVVVNCVLFPFTRARATRQLWEKYSSTCALLTQVCKQDDADPQLYYNLVIQAHLQEDKLHENAKASGSRDDMQAILRRCRQEVRSAHRKHPRMGYAQQA